jgi:beta-RFAP synthase
LGVGTQLSLAVARAIIQSATGDSPGAKHLAQLTGRGGRSAIGVHGFEHGGFLVDGGKRDSDELAPLIVRAEFPPEWRIVLLTPPANSTWQGERERAAFAAISGAPADDALCRLLLLGVLPALAERDLPAFGKALHEYNARAGEPFKAAQGGTFAPESAESIEWLRGQGVLGVGQSSWGPTVFAVAEDRDRAAAIKAAARRWRRAVDVTLTAVRNRGAGPSRAVY